MSRIAAYHRRLVLQGATSLRDRVLLGVLIPFSLCYGLLGTLRVAAYRCGILSSYRAPVPVISVGNLAAGGTGKTPVVDWLVKRLSAAGFHPAIVSRGYGGNYAGAVGEVSRGVGLLLTPEQAGDEPCLLARRNPQVSVLIAAKRKQGVAAAVDLGADCVILDDGFQHLAVRRDLDLVLFDATRPEGNGWPLPAGLLREFPRALRRADLRLLTRATGAERGFDAPQPFWTSRHRLASEAVDLTGRSIPLAQLRGKPLLAFAGIADPDNFFSGLKESGLTLQETLRFRDHEPYDQVSLERINAAAQGLAAILTTEKDAVKLAAEQFEIPCYQVPMAVAIDWEEELFAAILKRLRRKPMALSPELLEILACPQCKQPIELAEDGQTILCPACRLRYPVRDDIPVMLIDEAEPY